MGKTVAIVTNLQRECGNAQYGRDLAFNLAAKGYTVRLVAPGERFLLPHAIVVNWHPARVPLDSVAVQTWKAGGAKVIIVLQNSTEVFEDHGFTATLAAADAVVAHEPVEAPFKMTFIPHGIPEVSNLAPGPDDELTIGTAGFPFPWKRFDAVVEVARRLGCKARIYCPSYASVDSSGLVASWAEILQGRLEAYTEYLPTEEIVRGLSRNTVNIFFFESRSSDDRLGQTGSARLGIAARRPVVVSRHRKFRTLFSFREDQLYVAESIDQIVEYVSEIRRSELHVWTSVRYPRRILREQGWSESARRYAELIEALTA